MAILEGHGRANELSFNFQMFLASSGMGHHG